MVDWKDDGEQTATGEPITKIAKRFSGYEGLDFIYKALQWLKENLEFDKKEKENIFRKRKSSEILKDGFVTGCTDYVLAYIPLARYNGIPTKYVEALDRHWLKNLDRKGEISRIRGHVVARSKINDEWLIVDVDGGNIDLNINSEDRRSSSYFHRRFEIIGEGKDSWDLGIRSLEDLKEYIKNLG